jgi:leucyl/phenylalanyl-tRNA--protein transferase
MKRFHAKSPYRVTLNHAFGQVIEGCAEDRYEGTWITRDIITAYHQLHELGYAHSIEVWEGGALVGGMYGVAQGRCFAASRCSPARLTPRKPRCWSSAAAAGRLAIVRCSMSMASAPVATPVHRTSGCQPLEAPAVPLFMPA